jgi:hypothetical protein
MTDGTLVFTEEALTRRYFAKIERVLGAFARIAEDGGAEAGEGNDQEREIVSDHLERLANSFRALAYKHILTGRVTHRLPAQFEIDRRDSGFPVFREFVQLENDVDLVDEMLFDLPPRAKLKGEMIDHVLKYRRLPRDLQFAMAQRYYFESLKAGPLFLARNTPALQFVSTRPPHGHRRYIVDWAVYDTQRNLPDIYVMVLDEGADKPLHEDDAYAAKLGEALLNQSLSSLKLVTIASGVDADFPTVHPKSLKRIHLGPLYSNTFTEHSSELQAILTDHADEPGYDWVLAWTVESLASKGIEYVRSGLFGQMQKEIYQVDGHSLETFEAGSSTVERYMVLPLEAYQTLQDYGSERFADVHKFVVGADGEVATHT